MFEVISTKNDGLGATGYLVMSTVCLKVFTDSVPSFWDIETAWGGLKNEPQPTATISDIDPPLRHVSQELCSYEWSREAVAKIRGPRGTLLF